MSMIVVDRMPALFEFAADTYATCLNSGLGQEGRERLAALGVDHATVEAYRLGYAPGPDTLVRAAIEAGIPVADLLEARLGEPRTGSVGASDRFRRRMVFPQCDRDGAVCRLTARVVGSGQRPKYLDSSGDQGADRPLFGLQVALAAGTECEHLVLVRGVTDVIALYQIGVLSSVGLMGSALTELTAREIADLGRVIAITMDGSAASTDHTLRIARALTDQDVEVRVVALPAGASPASVIRERGASAIRERLGSSVSLEAYRDSG
jgi:DNA primase